MKNNPGARLQPQQIWLISFIVLVVLMIGIGGITRLTKSGLSIVEWKPLVGWIPPLTDADWKSQFDLYQASPEYQQVNSHFGISEYKQIFIWEYLHRVLGRIIFLVALLPGLWLWRKRQTTGWRVFILSALVASQGLIGWLMVKSGLNRDPHVSPYMLALHFFSALGVLITGYYYLSTTRERLPHFMKPQQRHAFWCLGLVIILQVFWGCLTSGLKAGFSFNTYPLMGDQFFPPGGFIQEPLLINFFENPSAVQWTHRWLGILVLLASLWLVQTYRHTSAWPQMKSPLVHLMGVIFSQIVLGILNIVLVVPTYLAVIHQICGALIVLTYFSIVFRLQGKPQQGLP